MKYEEITKKFFFSYAKVTFLKNKQIYNFEKCFLITFSIFLFPKSRDQRSNIIFLGAINESTNYRLRKEAGKKVKQEKRDLIILNSIPRFEKERERELE